LSIDSISVNPDKPEFLKFLRTIDRETPRKRIRRGAFQSVQELEQAISDYIEHNNTDPQPFVWTASAKSILDKVERARRAHQIVQKR
jgi:hypothetical protein